MIINTNDGHKVIECYADFHTHSTYSLHATASPNEMASVAARRGISMIAITDHAYNFDPFRDRYHHLNQNIRARNITEYLDPTWRGSWRDSAYDNDRNFCTRVIGGVEMNFFCNNFIIEDYVEPIGTTQGLKLIGLHDWFIPHYGVNITDVIDEFEKQAKFGKIHIFAHPDRDIRQLAKWSVQTFDGVLHSFCEIAEAHDIAMEINTSNKDSQDLLALMNVLKNHKCLITLGSDAHAPRDIGRDFDSALSILHEKGLLMSGRIVNIDKDLCIDMAHKAFPEMKFDNGVLDTHYPLCD